MSSAPYEIISGPASIFIAATGTTFPLIDATPSGSWTDLGKTDGGVEVANEHNVVEFMADQVTQPIKAIRSEQKIRVKFTLTEITLERLAKVLNSQTVTDTAAGSGVAGIRHFLLEEGADLPVWAMLVRGPSPYMAANMQFELPMVVQVSTFNARFSRQDRMLVATEWLAIYDSAGSTTGGKYGRLVAQDAAAL